MAGLTRKLAAPASTGSDPRIKSRASKALPGNPYNGHTLRQMIEEIQALTGREIERV